jgi:hypothetical protein
MISHRRCAGIATIALVAILLGRPAASRAVDGGVEAHDAHGARTFAIRVVRLLGSNRYAEAWAGLHPLHQEVAPLARYVECENLTPIPGRVTSVRALGTWSAPAHVAGLAAPVPGMKVKLRIVISEESIPARTVVVKTVAVVRVPQRWAWLLPPVRYAAYAAGECPG